MTNESNKALLELAERCEAATGPDRSIDFDIAEALQLTTQNEYGDTVLITRGSGFKPLNFTLSLDAAMTLVPEGWTGIIPVSGSDEAWLWERNGNPKGHRCNAATPALALCAAALRARASMTSEGGHNAR